MFGHDPQAFLAFVLAFATLSSACHADPDAPAAVVPDAGLDAGAPDASDPASGAPDSLPAVRPGPYRETRTLEANGVRVDAIIDRPANDAADALLLFHGTVLEDRLVLEAAGRTLDGFRAILDRDDLLLVSVAYPEEGLLMGDNVAHAEAALLWVRRHAAEALGVSVGRVFLAGHSQGGYIVTRLNTMHAVDGVIANAPGPLDLVFRCGLEESGRIAAGVTCGLLAEAYGSTTEAPEAYMARSLLSFTTGHRSEILFVQGLDDAPIQLRGWPIFRQRLEACSDCAGRDFLELEGLGHQALFTSPEARLAFNALLGRHSP
jgi:hypothetical protein